MSLTEQLAKKLAEERKPKHVLLVEDNDNDAYLTTEELRQWGYDVQHVQNGEMALDAASQNFFDIAIIDLCLPTMPGILVATRLSSLYQQMVIVICSGQVEAINALPEALRRGFFIVEKPFRISVLHKVGHALNAR